MPEMCWENFIFVTGLACLVSLSSLTTFSYLNGHAVRSVTSHADDVTLQRLVLGTQEFMGMELAELQLLLMAYGLLL